jgi:protease IV
MSNSPGIFRRLFATLWLWITRLRIALSNLLFLVVLVLLVAVFSEEAAEPLPDKAALLINPIGTVVEQKSYVDPVTLLFSEQAPSEQEVLLQDLIDSIRYAKDDPSITALVMELEMLFGIGISKSEAIAAAIADFRTSSKPVVAWGDYFSQGQYFLAAQADTVILHPMGAVEIEGFGSYQWYLKDALEKLSVSAHVFRAGKYKSAVEPIMRSDMSAAEREVSQRWLSQLWGRYSASIEEQRDLEVGAVSRYAEAADQLLQEHGGDPAATALNYGLVDRLDNRVIANRYLVDLVGDEDDEGRYQAIEYDRYLAHKQPLIKAESADSVGVITAKGNILDGDQAAGSIGGNSLGRLIADAALDEEVKAIVLRVDSGGGSAFASEVIRERIRFAQAQGKPVVVSMGSVAASGGYWIAADADEIWATPTTLTGSIGVFGIVATVDGLLNRMGVYVDGVGSTDIAGSLRVDRPLDDRIGRIMQANVDSIYGRFLRLVAHGRDMEVEAVAELAAGRVWSGTDAFELGLVDHLGDLDEAVAAAARLAKLEKYEVERIELPQSPQEMFLAQLRGGALLDMGLSQLVPEWLQRSLLPVREQLQFLSQMNDPAGVYVRCESCSGL